MPSLYAQYVFERERLATLEVEHGFATYEFLPQAEAVYIHDIFVEREYRKSKVGSELADAIVKIAKSRNCKKLIGSVAPKTNGATVSVKALLAYGFELDSCDGNLIYFIKNL